MGDKKTVNKKSRRIDVWITFTIFSVVTSGWIIYASLHTLALIMYSPVEAMGFAFANALIIYFLGVIPSKVMWEHLKK